MSPAQKFEFGTCSLSKDGFCEAEGECPYGCDIDVRECFETERRLNQYRMVSDRVYVLFRLLVQSAWVEEFSILKSDYLVEKYAINLKIVRSYATPWVWDKFKYQWPVFWPEFHNDVNNRIALLSMWETKLYQTYSSNMNLQ